MKTLTVYSFDELLKESQQRAIEDYKDKHCDQECFWASEMIDSLKALFNTCEGVKLKDYSLGECNSNIDVEFNRDEAGELSGKRAFAWIENNLLYQFRYKAGINHIKERVWRSDCVKSITRPDGAFIHQIGEIKGCPFTGYCFDEDLLDSLLNDIKEGCDLKTAFEGLANIYQKQLNAEIDYQNSDEYIKEQLSNNDDEFLANGQKI